jgi:hypothetical protein
METARRTLRDQPPSARTILHCRIKTCWFCTVIIEPIQCSICVYWRSQIQRAICRADNNRHCDDDNNRAMPVISIDVAVVGVLPMAHAVRLSNHRARQPALLCIGNLRSASDCRCRNRDNYPRDIFHRGFDHPVDTNVKVGTVWTTGAKGLLLKTAFVPDYSVALWLESGGPKRAAVASRLATTRDNTETPQGGRRSRSGPILESLSASPKIGILGG